MRTFGKRYMGISTVTLLAAFILIAMTGCSSTAPSIEPDNLYIEHKEPVLQTTCKKHRCEGTFSVIYGREQPSGKCEVQFQVPCMPYPCNKDTGLCVTECKMDKDCIPGSKCNVVTRQCVSVGYDCKDDFTVIYPGGVLGSTQIDCRPYKCSAGVCRDTCSTTNDCSHGYDCQGGRCYLK